MPMNTNRLFQDAISSMTSSKNTRPQSPEPSTPIHHEPINNMSLLHQQQQQHELPSHIAQSTLVTYRSIGIGAFGMGMRFLGMPLEKIALFLNSSQVSGQGQFRQAIRLTFQSEGRMNWLAPYRVVGPASLAAWFFQYAVMGFAFPFFDQGLSKMMGVAPVCYGSDLMKETPSKKDCSPQSVSDSFKSASKLVLAPLLAASLESVVSNRAEVQRYFGKEVFASLQIQRKAYLETFSPMARAAGAGFAFTPNLMRNMIMVQTTFLLTPITYQMYFPQERKNPSSLFWYGLSMNILVGNVAAITQQALWGRTLDAIRNTAGRVHYKDVIVQSLRQDGTRAFFTPLKWFSRVLMNAPAQGVLPWFYNEILPVGEPMVLSTAKACYQMYQEATTTTDLTGSMEGMVYGHNGFGLGGSNTIVLATTPSKTSTTTSQPQQ